MTRASPNKRGRPRAYNPAVALRRARDTFWLNGFAATSLDDLAARMEMNRPSIYAAFGDKRALYRRCVTDYAQNSRDWLASALTEALPLRDGLRAVYREARDFYLVGEQGARGCFLIGTAVTEANADEATRIEVEATMTAFTEAFAERFERAERQGELSPHAPDALARIATAALNTLAVRARMGASRDELDALIDATVDVVCARPD
ncbi:TetR/AcrR family transcriptional regulator [Mycobacterium deserti]|uniref:TetR/AcrR family transcriptional regulator n=1 Tax=Mycobacterium deserti TaxID=2978347 RepID=A0ABT2MEC4_9MYCO|nr:TetR/AcrR family transcriptional regulator [Mycobacterium deserti]MCT7659919.1 TetR/AcrR family transcriptional regulator [Mycobacterium deserti]